MTSKAIKVAVHGISEKLSFAASSINTTVMWVVWNPAASKRVKHILCQASLNSRWSIATLILLQQADEIFHHSNTDANLAMQGHTKLTQGTHTHTHCLRGLSCKVIHISCENTRCCHRHACTSVIYIMKAFGCTFNHTGLYIHFVRVLFPVSLISRDTQHSCIQGPCPSAGNNG